MTLKDNFNPQTKIYANWMGWFTPSGGKHMAGVCDSQYPKTVLKQIQMAKAVGIDGFVIDWYGTSSQPSAEATEILAMLCGIYGLEFSIMFDSGIYKWASTDPIVRSQVLQDAVNYAKSNFFNLPQYSKINGQPIAWEFGWRGNPIATNPDMGTALLLSQDTIMAPAGGTFAWVNGFAPDTPEAYLGRYLAKQDPIQVPCVFWGFDDHNPSDPTHSIWDSTKPARFIDPKFGDTWINCVNAINLAGKVYPAVQLCTWNDYDERTAIEPFVKAITGTKLL